MAKFKKVNDALPHDYVEDQEFYDIDEHDLEDYDFSDLYEEGWEDDLLDSVLNEEKAKRYNK